MALTFAQDAPGVTTTCTAGSRLEVLGLNQHTKGRQTLHDVSFTVEPGEIVAIVGGSGAGKTTLLEAMVGIRPASSGSVVVDGVDVSGVDPSGSGVGYVPQDDIIHRDMPLGRTLRHAAALRLPAGTSKDTIDRVVDETLARLDLLDRREVRVGALSGGQRKRASIAVELLTRPHLFYLDEPTSGLDPATGTEFMRQLRKLTGCTTIVLTTHNPDDIELCDRVVFLARDGHVAFAGTPVDAHTYFGVDHLVRAYDRLATEDTPRIWAARFATSSWASPANLAPEEAQEPGFGTRPVSRSRQAVGPVSQWLTLTRRNAELMVRNKLTLTLLVGAPVMVISMMATLFRPGTYEPGQASPMPAIQTTFWVAFAAFFFGVTYGLLQIVGEISIFRRERLSGLGIGAYIASKVAVLTPLLVVASVAMLAIFRSLDRLPAASWSVWAELLVTIVLVSVAALTMGLLTSAAVNDTVQAFAAYPMLCFPQALFAGAVVAVPEMTVVGRGMSFGLANRWGFESLGRVLGLDANTTGHPAASGYEPAFAGTPFEGWLILVGMIVAAGLATAFVLRAKSRPGAR